MGVFEDGASSTIAQVNEIFAQRGGQYKDTWQVDNQVPGFVDALRSAVGDDHSREANRLIRLAALVDTKISRITSGGKFNPDHYVDLIAYLALLKDLHERYTAPAHGFNNVGNQPEDTSGLAVDESELRYSTSPRNEYGPFGRRTTSRVAC